MKTISKLLALAALSLIPCRLPAQSTVALQQATATYSQPNYPVSSVLSSFPSAGWAVARLEADPMAETAVFETVQDVQLGTNAILTFHLRSGGFPGANLGRYRLSVTSDDRSLFADGLANGGAVAANWEVLNPQSLTSIGGATLTNLPDGSILASGVNPDFDTNVIVAVSSLARITGVRIETIKDDSLPAGGPGRHENGNCVLYRLVMTAKASTEDLRLSIKVSAVDICWQGLPFRTYQVQYSSALTTNFWTNFGDPVQGNGTNCVTDIIRGTEKRFYQVIYAQ